MLLNRYSRPAIRHSQFWKQKAVKNEHKHSKTSSQGNLQPKRKRARAGLKLPLIVFRLALCKQKGQALGFCFFWAKPKEKGRRR
ncbi:hypothetical protein ASE92_06695 [Pedobacter sp. Leaf41]|nr:hypothetical protein ASE92_06695 [Pedobacter sp. Leaf41]